MATTTLATNGTTSSPLASFESVYGQYRVFILDIDGTIINGDAQIEGVIDSVYRLLIDEDKKVLFYTNGGYCTLEHSF